MAEIIDGKKIASELATEVKDEVGHIKEKYGAPVGLAVVFVGDNPASAVYVRNKIRACGDVGITSFEFKLPEATTQDTLLELINRLNSDKSVNGILVQLPLPGHIAENKIIEAIDPIKDVDGLHPVNVGRLVIGEEDAFLPCTPAGCRELISRTVKDLKGKHVVVVGRSNLVGKPMANLMMQKNEKANCTVTVCHTGTSDIAHHLRQADIVVAAAGSPGSISGDMLKPGSVVIDVGTTRIDDPDNPGKTRLTGDVKFSEAVEVAAAITPVPGGVGPMTIAMLLKNTVKAFKLQNGIREG